jgi:hypothetical protein
MIPPSMSPPGHPIPPHLRTPMGERVGALVAGALVLVLLSCGDAPESGEGGAAAAAAASVRISQPAAGATVAGGSVLVTLEVSGLTIAPAGTMDAGTGHHHLVVDAELPAAGVPIPSTPGVHIHMGQAQTEYELTGLEPGEHTVIAVVGDGAHIPLNPWVVDTLRFVVQ